MADFKFYLNRQGVRGAKGEKGDKGFSPSIEVGKNTQEEFTLMIVNEDGTVETPNIKEGLVPEDRGGTYVRKDPTTGLQYYGSADLGTVDNIGEVQLASTQDLENTQVGDVESDKQPAKGKAVDGLAAVEFFASNKNLSTVSQEVQNLSTEIGSIKNEQAKQDTEIQSNASDIANLNIDVNNLKTNKQNKLKAGANITLTDNPDGTTTVASTGGGSGTGDVTAAGNNTFTGSNTFTSTTTFNAPIAVSSGGSTIETSLNGDTSTYIDLKVNSQADLILGTGTVVTQDADGGSHVRQGKIIDGSGNVVLTQGNVTAGNNITITKTGKGIQIASSGGGGEAPANMVTTDTDQDITGVKRFLNNRQDLSKPAIKIGNYAAGQDTYDGGYITSAGSNYLEIGSYYATNSKGGFLSINSTADSSIFKITSNNSNINPRLQLGITNYEGEIYNDIAEGLCLSNRKYDYSGQRSILKIKDDTLTFKKTDGTVVDLLAGGSTSITGDEYYYKAGDVFTNESYAILPAIFSNTKTQILMSIPMPKSMKNVSNISVTKCVLSVRIPSGGYLPSLHFDFLAEAGTTISAFKAFGNLLTIRIDKTKGWGTQVANNVPLSVQISPADLIVEFN